MFLDGLARLFYLYARMAIRIWIFCPFLQVWNRGDWSPPASSYLTADFLASTDAPDRKGSIDKGTPQSIPVVQFAIVSSLLLSIYATLPSAHTAFPYPLFRSRFAPALAVFCLLVWRRGVADWVFYSWGMWNYWPGKLLESDTPPHYDLDRRRRRTFMSRCSWAMAGRIANRCFLPLINSLFSLLTICDIIIKAGRAVWRRFVLYDIK